MKTTTTSATALASAANVHALVKEAFDAVGASFERFCLMAGIESLTQMLGEDVDTLAGGRYEHRPDKPGYRWGQAKAQVGFHGGKIEVDRPRVRNKATGKEMTLPSWEEIAAGGFLDQWAVNLMVMNVDCSEAEALDGEVRPDNLAGRCACRKPGFRHKLAAGFQSLRSHVASRP